MVQENLQINIGANTQDLQQGLNQATASVTNFSNSLNRATKPTADATNSLTNLSRIAQDAPYGFMGIANNLNPMLESFQRLQKEAGGSGAALKAMAAGLTGPAGIGVALGVVSSLIVAFGDDINDYFNKLSMGSTISTQYKDAFKAIGSEFTSAVEKVDKMQIAFNQYHAGLITGDAALKLYNEGLGKNLGVKKSINEAEDEFINKKNAYLEASLQRALADAAGKKAAEELLKQKVLERAPEKTGEFGKMITGELSKALLSPLLQKPITDKLVNLYDEDKTEKDINKAKDLIANYKKIQEDAKNLEAEILKKSGITLDPEKDKKTKPQVDTSRLDTLKKEQQLYKDDIYKFKDYADLIAEEEKKVALKRAEINKAGKEEIKAINEQYDIALKQNTKNLGIEIMKIADQNTKDFEKQEKEAKKKLLDSQEQASREALEIVKRQYDIDNKLAGDSYDKKREAIKKAMAQINILLALSSNPKAIVDLERSYKDLEKSFQILDIDEQQKNTKKLNDSYEKFAKTIATNVTNGLMTMWDAMQKGENPLKAIGDMLMGIVEQLAAAVIQALILETILEAFGAGGAAVGGGGFWKGVGKILGLADGGIVSSPTMAMVGEGGQSEAIMPLSKLGNMMNSTFAAGAMSGGNVGGGNGQFVLKGNDLVLALQRSNYSLNLRRGA